MAFMQETPRSLRAYLLLVGVLQTAANLYLVLSVGEPLARLFRLVGLVIGVGFLWIGISFRSLMASARARIEQVLIVGAAYSILLGLIRGSVGQAIGGLLITLYLLRNVRRLGGEGDGDDAPVSIKPKNPNSAA